MQRSKYFQSSLDPCVTFCYHSLLILTASFYLYAGKYGEENDVEEVFHT